MNFSKIYCLLLLLPQLVYSAGYLSFSNANVQSEQSLLSQNGENEDRNLSGLGSNIQVGYFITNPMAIEFSYTNGENEDVKGHFQSGESFKITSEFEFVSLGLRWYLWEFLNLKTGAVRYSYRPKITSDLQESGFDDSQITDNGPYVGAGVGLTLSNVQIFFDITNYKRSNTKDSKVSEIGLRAFF